MATRRRPETLSTIYDAAWDAQLWPRALDAVAREFRAAGALIKPYDRAVHVVSAHSPGLAAAVDDYRRNWWDKDVRHLTARRLGIEEGLLTDQDLFTPEEIRESEYYQGFLKRHGLGVAIWQVMRPLPEASFTFSVQRSFELGSFSDAEIRRFKDIARHVCRAVAISARTWKARSLEATLSAVLDRLHAGIIILDRDGWVVFANKAAEGASPWGANLHGARLLDRESPLQAQLNEFLSAALDLPQRSRPMTICLPQERKPSPWILQAIPLRSAKAEYSGFFNPAAAICLLLVIDLDSRIDPSRVPLLTTLGLTPGEARLAARIGAGSSLKEAAAALNIKEQTARFVLKRIFSKLHLERQSDLVGLVWQIGVAADSH